MTNIIKRFSGITVTCIFFSAFYNFFQNSVTVHENSLKLLVVFLFMLFLSFHFYFSRRDYYFSEDDMDYNFFNITAVVFFTVLNIVMFFLLNKNTYNWLFSITSILKLFFPSMGNVVSIILYSVVILIVTLLVPFTFL